MLDLRVLYPVLDTNKCERCRYARRGTEKSNENDSKFMKLIKEMIEKVRYIFSKM